MNYSSYCPMCRMEDCKKWFHAWMIRYPVCRTCRRNSGYHEDLPCSGINFYSSNEVDIQKKEELYRKTVDGIRNRFLVYTIAGMIIALFSLTEGLCKTLQFIVLLILSVMKVLFVSLQLLCEFLLNREFLLDWGFLQLWWEFLFDGGLCDILQLT